MWAKDNMGSFNKLLNLIRISMFSLNHITVISIGRKLGLIITSNKHTTKSFWVRSILEVIHDRY